MIKKAGGSSRAYTTQISRSATQQLKGFGKNGSLSSATGAES